MDVARRRRTLCQPGRWPGIAALALGAMLGQPLLADPPLPMSLAPPSAVIPKAQRRADPPPAAIVGPQLLAPPSAPLAIPAPAQMRAPERTAPEELGPWWRAQIGDPLKPGAPPRRMGLEGIVLETLEHSAQVRVLSEAPVIRKQSIYEAQSRFDVRTFMESKFVDTSEPVGSLLTTGGASRYVDQNMRYSAGLRKKALSGGQFEVSQRLGYENSNSIYFVPPYQGTARLTVGFTQPLLNGAGCQYNESLIVIAQVETAAAQAQMARELQALLVDVHRAYWELYLQRALLLQKRKLFEEAVNIRFELQARREVDVLGSQLVRAEAAVASRQAAIIRHEAGVKNAEARLCALINDPAWLAGQKFELIPMETPAQRVTTINLEQALVESLQKRPEIGQATAEIRAASVKAEMACNELLPVLNLILESYVSGLDGYSNVPQSFNNQFADGRPTYSAGLVFEYPLGNRGANARLTQRRLEVRLLTSQLQALTANIRAEVEVAVREVQTTHRELESKFRAMQAEQAEIDYLTQRWKLLPDDQQGAGVVLDDVLRAQERLADSEAEFAQSQLAYNMALVELKRVTGSLLEWEAITPHESCHDCLPTLTHQKGTEVPVARPAPAVTAPPKPLTERIPTPPPSATRVPSRLPLAR